MSQHRDSKDSRKRFHRYVANKIKSRDNVGPLQQETGDLSALDKEKDEVLNEFCISVFNRKFSSHTTQAENKLKFRTGTMKTLRSLRERVKFETT